MMRHLSSALRRRGLAVLLVATALLVLPATVRAQAVRVFFWPEAKPPENPDQGITTLLLRPNTTQQFFLFVHNGGQGLKNVVIDLRAGGKSVATATLANVPAGTQAVSFPPTTPPPPPAGAAQPAPAPKPPELKELPGEVEVVALLDNKE